MSERILEEFDTKKGLYELFTTKIAGLIREILAGHGINVHTVTHRTKDRTSLTNKITKEGSSYTQLSDITDISGVRITTFFEEDVDRIVDLIEQEFAIDRENSVDKRTLLDPDHFGYLSTHHVISLGPGRCELLEYRRFSHLKLEIQTRSILQHAWTEIERGLGYKSKDEVPKEVRRKFSRLAGLLELADSEFTAIRKDLAAYDATLGGQIKEQPQSIEIDKDSLIAFARTNNSFQSIENNLASLANWRIIENDDTLGSYVERLNYVGIHTIGELEDVFQACKDLILKFAENWVEGKQEKERPIQRGISLFYLCYVLQAQAQDENKVVKYLKKYRIKRMGTSVEEIAHEIIEIYEKIEGQRG